MKAKYLDIGLLNFTSKGLDSRDFYFTFLTLSFGEDFYFEVFCIDREYIKENNKVFRYLEVIIFNITVLFLRKEVK